MRFHDYATMKPPSERGTTEEWIRRYFSVEKTEKPSASSFGACVRGVVEFSWLTHDRPFYNVYPIAIELCAKTSLTMTWGDILLPTKNLLLRFPAGFEPLGIKSALIRAPSSQKLSTPMTIDRGWEMESQYASCIELGGIIQTTATGGDAMMMWAYGREDGHSLRTEVIKDSVIDRADGANHASADEPFGHRCDFLIRLLAFIGLLARGNDLITPAILSKDRGEYDATSDGDRKRWLESRAARRLGHGFDVGRSLEIERASSPHWRSPHLALFHTGPGRAVPVLKVRSGCVVIPKDMTSVPTGYMGEESPDETPTNQPPVFRTSVPWRMRFRIMRRDGRRCQMCGMTAADGVRLEVDHKVPVAKGGKTVEDNLWVLCQPCNGGKSDSDLHLATSHKGETNVI
jgi:HNH endonuclease